MTTTTGELDILSEEYEVATREEIALLKRHRPTTNDELHALIKVCLGWDIPRVAVCDHHCAPFDALADIYFMRVQRAIIIADREGGKTLINAILAYLFALHEPRVECAVVGAIEKQAIKCYSYIKQFAKFDAEHGLCDPPAMKETRFTNGAKLEILSAKSRTSVNSPHPHRACIDEFELIDWALLNEAFLMLSETKDHIGVMWLTSTRKDAAGTVAKMLEEAGEKGYKVYAWCGLETTERCAEEGVRSTCDHCKTELVRTDSHNREVAFFDICQGLLRKANGFRTVNALWNKFKDVDVEVFKTQVAPCSEPTRGNACFSEFDAVHVAPERLSYNPDWEIGSGSDFGLQDPDVTIVVQRAGNRLYVIDEFGSGRLYCPTNPTRLCDAVADEVLEQPYSEAYLESPHHWADPAGKSKKTYTRTDDSPFLILRAKGIMVRGKKKPNPARRIRAIKMLLRLAKGTRRPRVIISPHCKLLIRALKYAQWDEGRECYEHDEHSHPLDAFGYIVEALFPVRSHFKGGGSKARSHGLKPRDRSRVKR